MAQLPPKIPNMNPHWPDYFSGHHQKLPLQPFVAAAPAMNAAPSTPVQSSSSSNNNNGNNNPSWVDEFLDFSHARRGAHRRSASDSIAFLDSASLLGDACRLDVGAGDNVASAGPGSNADSGSDFERFDDEHLMSMFTDEISPKPVNIDNNNGATAGTAISSLNPSMPSDRNSINEEKLQLLDRRRTDHQMMKMKMKMKMKDEVEEVHSPCDSETGNASTAPSTATVNATGPSDRIVDPKRVKRILANRQSAQRSRVRKLQYIAELERSVTSLQAEVAVLSPRVAFLDHQRLLLNVDNSTLKQRIAALAQDKIFKDAHQEALKREIERLRQVYHQQSLNNMEDKNATPTSSLPLAPASDVPTAIPIREQQLAS